MSPPATGSGGLFSSVRKIEQPSITHLAGLLGRAQAPNGSRKQTGPFVAAESEARRAFAAARNKTARPATKTVHRTANEIILR